MKIFEMELNRQKNKFVTFIQYIDLRYKNEKRVREENTKGIIDEKRKERRIN